MEPSPPSLPEELLQIIANCTAPADLPAFRSATRDFKRLSQGAFVEHHVVRRKHVWTAHSLRALLDILTHPEFGEHVRDITLVAVSPVRDPVERHISESLQFIQRDQPSLRALRLDRIFQHLRTAKRNVSLRLSTEATDLPRFGTDQICHEHAELDFTGYRPIMFSPSDHSGGFGRDVLTVLAASHYPLQVLSLSIPDLHAQAFEFPPTQSTEITRAFHALRELEIRSKVLEALSDDLWVGQGYNLVDMMKQAVALEGLKLDAQGGGGNPRVFPCCQRPQVTRAVQRRPH